MSVFHGRRVRVGDRVIALRDGERDLSRGLSVACPRRGGVYRIPDIYPMWYDLGCQLEGLNPTPFKGYFLWKRGRTLDRHKGRSYSRRIEANDALLERLFAKTKGKDRKRVREKEDA